MGFEMEQPMFISKLMEFVGTRASTSNVDVQLTISGQEEVVVVNATIIVDNAGPLMLWTTSGVQLVEADLAEIPPEELSDELVVNIQSVESVSLSSELREPVCTT